MLLSWLQHVMTTKKVKYISHVYRQGNLKLTNTKLLNIKLTNIKLHNTMLLESKYWKHFYWRDYSIIPKQNQVSRFEKMKYSSCLYDWAETFYAKSHPHRGCDLHKKFQLNRMKAEGLKSYGILFGNDFTSSSVWLAAVGELQHVRPLVFWTSGFYSFRSTLCCLLSISTWTTSLHLIHLFAES